MDGNLPITGAQVDFREEFSAVELVNEVISTWEWIGIFNGLFI